MKKLSVLFLVLLLLVLSACGEKTNSENADENLSSNVSVVSESEKPTVTEAELKELFDKNIYSIYNIFELGFLEYDAYPMEGSLYPVYDPQFKSFADLENYVKAIYCEKTANRLLYEPKYQDHILYSEVDGVFCIDIAATGGKGYYVDWTDYKISIDEIDNSTCNFKVIASIEEPSDNPTKQPYEKSGKAVFENGKWLLEDMVY